jgi:hypothetical protein
MRISGRDLKKIIKEEIGREMKQHANNETAPESEMHEEITPERDAYLKKTSPMYRAMNDPDLARRTMDYMDGIDTDLTASTREPMDFGTTKITPDEVIDIDDALPEGKNITERLMERWLK